MSDYGVKPTGFVRKDLQRIKTDIEQNNITEYGPGVIQTAQSPLGQINGLFADLTAELWELAEEIYASYDPDQAEGTRIDTLGKLRLAGRPGGLSDADYRSLVTNAGVARVTLADVTTAVRGVDGVTWAVSYVNEEGIENEDGMPPNSVAVAVLGGLDENVAALVNRYLPPGVSSFGNLRVTALEDGFCRSMRIIRPVEMEVKLTVRIIRGQTRKGCPSPSPMAIGTSLFEYLTDPATRPWNGEGISPYMIRSFLEKQFEGVEFDSLRGFKIETSEEYNTAIPIAFFEIAKIESVVIEVID